MPTGRGSQPKKPATASTPPDPPAVDYRALLAAPTPRAARAVALVMLDALEAAYARLGNRRDSEALHDFRVALRRLRSWLRAYKREVRDSVKRSTLDALRTLAAASNDSRDLEVQIAMMAALAAGTRGHSAQARSARRTARQVRLRLAAEKRRADGAFRDVRTRSYAPLVARLRRQLARYSLRVVNPATTNVWAQTASARAIVALERFHGSLLAIGGEFGDELAHEARIAGKRLRYTLEPLVGLVEGAREAVVRLKVGQDLLGDMHDAYVLARILRRAPATEGGAALLARVERKRRAAWSEFSNRWVTDALPALAADVRRAADTLAESAGAGVEIERKYLLKRLPPEARGAARQELEQGYLPGAKLIERIRRVTEGDTVNWFRTVKGGRGLVRTELEEPTTAKVFRAFWPLTKGKRIHKYRYRIADGPLVWEIDEFLDRRLVLAEVELRSPEQQVTIPEWLAPHVVREVTDDDHYSNFSLSR